LLLPVLLLSIALTLAASAVDVAVDAIDPSAVSQSISCCSPCCCCRSNYFLLLLLRSIDLSLLLLLLLLLLSIGLLPVDTPSIDVSAVSFSINLLISSCCCLSRRSINSLIQLIRRRSTYPLLLLINLVSSS
jgi:hypothetical protein